MRITAAAWTARAAITYWIKRMEVHCNKNPIYVFREKELRGLSPNFHIHVSVSDLYIPRIGQLFGRIGGVADQSWEYINRSQAHKCGNWNWGRELPFLGIFVSNFQYCVFPVCTRANLINVAPVFSGSSFEFDHCLLLNQTESEFRFTRYTPKLHVQKVNKHRSPRPETFVCVT